MCRQIFGDGEGVHTGGEGLQSLLVVFDDFDRLHEGVHAEAGGEARGAGGRQHVVGTGHVVAQRNRGVRATEDGAGVADLGDHGIRISGLHFKVFGRVRVGRVDGLFDAVCEDDLETVCTNIREKLIAGVEKRLDADAPVGFLLSGGLDSSLVCSIAAKKLGKPIRTFAIGMDTDAIDLKYARQTAEYLGSEHHEIIINRDIVIQNLEEVIRLLGTWDITTIRASMGMYLLCKAIHEQTDVRVLLTGEISDELFGYKYTDYAPTADAFQQESQKRIRELYMYDVLRADRCISANSIEARVPFGDLDFVRYVMAIDPEKKLNSYGKGKYLLRKAFEGDWLPPEILWREKAAFSDAVGHSMVDDIKEYAESLYTDEEFQLRRANYSAHCMPFTKESLFYREIFEKYYHDQSRTIVGFWMPNKAWPGCNVNDPSARVLANYGASGV